MIIHVKIVRRLTWIPFVLAVVGQPGWTILGLGEGTAFAAPPEAELISVEKIWDQAPHNAFTDLIRYKGQWFCAFREGSFHASPDGKLRVIRSRHGDVWTSSALLEDPNADLRDAKLSRTPDGQLMLTGAAALHQPAEALHQTLVWFSDDGETWSDPQEIGEPNLWLWDVTWHKRIAYGVGYHTAGGGFARLYQSDDGVNFETLVPVLLDQGRPSEASIAFDEHDVAYCLIRRSGLRDRDRVGQLGTAMPPYTDWTWKDLTWFGLRARIGGPKLVRMPDGRWVAGLRLYLGLTRMALAGVDPETGELNEFLLNQLPSGGDATYPGIVFHGNLLWVSYYSSHEDKTSIYLAKVKLPPPTK